MVHNHTMSDDNFAAFDAILSEEVNRISALKEENAHLRELLAERIEHSVSSPFIPAVSSPTGSPSSSPTRATAADMNAATLAAELAATKTAQAALAKELELLRSKNRPDNAIVEDHSSEVALLRSSLATLASELELEKTRVAEIEAKRREEEDKVATLRSKVEESRRALMRLQGESTRRTSLDGSIRRTSLGVDNFNSPRRKSSLGVNVNLGGLGLGLGVESPTQANAKVSLARLAHRRGSASISSYTPDSREEDDRMARLRDLRLGLTSTKVASRANSLVNGNDFLGGTDLSDFGPERHRIPSISFPSGRADSISEEGHGDDEDGSSPISRPPSAPLRYQGRKQSVAVFDDFSSRRSSYEYNPAGIGAFLTPTTQRLSVDFHNDKMQRSISNPGGETLTAAELMSQLQGLRIQLAESEEGRRASEHCLKALREFIAASPSLESAEMRLPPLPTDVEFDHSPSMNRKVSVGSRWSIGRFGSIGGVASRRDSTSSRRDSAASLLAPSIAGLSPNLTTYTRRSSSQSNITLDPIPAGQTPQFKSSLLPASSLPSSSSHTSSSSSSGSSLTPIAPIFGAFSFSALVSRTAGTPYDIDGDASPTNGQADSFPTEPSPIAEEDFTSSESEEATTSSTTDSRAPSLTDSFSSTEGEGEEETESEGSLRSASPVEEEEMDIVGIMGQMGVGNPGGIEYDGVGGLGLGVAGAQDGGEGKKLQDPTTPTITYAYAH